MSAAPISLNATITHKLATVRAAVAVLSRAGIVVAHIDMQDVPVSITVAYSKACPKLGARRIGPAHFHGRDYTRWRAKVCGAWVEWLEPA